MDFTVKQGDSGRRIKAQLRRNKEGAVDLTEVTEVRFHMRPKGSETISTNGIVHVSDAAEGIVEYTLTDVDTAVSGAFEAEFEVAWDQDGTDVYETFPSFGYIKVFVTPEIA